MIIVSIAGIKKELQTQLIHNHPDVDFRFYKKMNEAEKDLPVADAIITYGENLTAENIQSANHLKWIMVISAGVERLPFQAIKEKNILVTNARGIHKIPMAEYTFAAILQWCKKMKQWTVNQDKRIWSKYGLEMNELAGQTMTVVGTGAIGGEIARLAKAFRVHTLGVNRSGRKVEYFDEIYTISEIERPLTRSDIVVSVLPYTPETDHLIGKKQFDAMKEDSLFINIGRGNTVDQAELLSVLQSRKISAVLDVFEQEPLPEDHPFWGMENVVVTPHFSSISSLYQPRAFDIFEKNLLLFKENRTDLINLVDLDRGY